MKFLVKSAKFLAAETLIVCTFIAQIFSVFFILFVQLLIPAFRRLFEINEKIMYILPVFAVLFLSLLFVKINNKFFQMRLRDVIKKFFIAVFFCVILVVLLGFFVSFLVSLIPASTVTTIKNIAGLPFAILMILGGPSFFLLLISLIGMCIVCIIAFPLILFTGFSIVSIYEKLPRIPKSAISLLIKVFLVAYFITVVIFGFRRSLNDMFVDEYDKSYLYTVRQIHRQKDYDFKKDELGFFAKMVNNKFPVEALQLFIDYGFDLKEHRTYLNCVNTKEHVKFFAGLKDSGIDPNVFIMRVVEAPFEYGYDTVVCLLDAGADVNFLADGNHWSLTYAGAWEYHDGCSVIQNFLYNTDSLLRTSKLSTEESYREIERILKLLVERGADLNFRNKHQDTALGCLVSNYGLVSHKDFRDFLIYYLLENGADPKISLPDNITLRNMHYWFKVSDDILEIFRESGRK